MPKVGQHAGMSGCNTTKSLATQGGSTCRNEKPTTAQNLFIGVGQHAGTVGQHKQE